MTRDRKLDLLNRAKDAYYNTGNELLTDDEYDALEAELGLENKSYIGSKQGNYDVKHEFIMGSLAKAQVKESKDGTINWEEVADTITSYLRKSSCSCFETTPKLDGCSFSAEFINKNGKAKLKSVATRGNGEWGTDIEHWFLPVLSSNYWSKIDEVVSSLCALNSSDVLCIRGEVLVQAPDFAEKYSDAYVNPRAFTAGMLGLKYEDVSEDKLMQGNDLHFVCYDYRILKNGSYEELSWMNPSDKSYSKLRPYLNHIGELPDSDFCQVHKFNGRLSTEDVMSIYKDYEFFRKNESEYPLDGIVFKPECSKRVYNVDRTRPVDCIAMKFMPMINITKIVDIEWNVKKTGEYFPKAILEPIKMEDGKTVTRASLHSYDYIMTNRVGIGSTVRISLAGDIIPFVYEIIESKDPEGNMHLPADGYVKTSEGSGNMHYMKRFSEYEEQKNMFLSSALTLNINTIGPAAAENLYDSLYEDIPDLTNIVFLMNDDAYKLIYDKLGTGKSIDNIVVNLEKYASKMTLVDLIRSFCFKLCGDRASELCARIISGLSYSPAGFSEESYRWALDRSSKKYYMVKKTMEDLGIEPLEEENNIEDKTPIIMTGSPDECTKYSTKGAWIKAHPEFIETSSWKDCKILFTNDLDSNTGKMKKAKQLGIEIRRYE